MSKKLKKAIAFIATATMAFTATSVLPYSTSSTMVASAVNSDGTPDQTKGEYWGSFNDGLHAIYNNKDEMIPGTEQQHDFGKNYENSRCETCRHPLKTKNTAITSAYNHLNAQYELKKTELTGKANELANLQKDLKALSDAKTIDDQIEKQQEVVRTAEGERNTAKADFDAAKTKYEEEVAKLPAAESKLEAAINKCKSFATYDSKADKDTTGAFELEEGKWYTWDTGATATDTMKEDMLKDVTDAKEDIKELERTTEAVAVAEDDTIFYFQTGAELSQEKNLKALLDSKGEPVKDTDGNIVLVYDPTQDGVDGKFTSYNKLLADKEAALTKAQNALKILQDALASGGTVDDTVIASQIVDKEKRVNDLIGLEHNTNNKDTYLDTLKKTEGGKDTGIVVDVSEYAQNPTPKDAISGVTPDSEIGKLIKESKTFLTLYTDVKKEYDAIATGDLASGAVAGMALTIADDAKTIIAKLYLNEPEDVEAKVTVKVGTQTITAETEKEEIKIDKAGESKEYTVYNISISPKEYDKAIEVKVGTADTQTYSVENYLAYAETYLDGQNEAAKLAVELGNYCKAVKTYLAESASKQTDFPFYSGSINSNHKYKGSAIVITDNAEVELRNYYDVNGTIRYKDSYVTNNTARWTLNEDITTVKFRTNAKSTVKDYKEKLDSGSSAYKVVDALIKYNKAYMDLAKVQTKMVAANNTSVSEVTD